MNLQDRIYEELACERVPELLRIFYSEHLQ